MIQTKLLFSLIIILFLSSFSIAQSPSSKLKPDLLDISWASTIIGDRISTNIVLSNCSYCYEGSPIKNNNLRMALDFSLLGTVKFLEYKYPDRPKTFRIFKGIMVGLGTGVIIHNLN